MDPIVDFTGLILRWTPCLGEAPGLHPILREFQDVSPRPPGAPLLRGDGSQGDHCAKEDVLHE